MPSTRKVHCRQISPAIIFGLNTLKGIPKTLAVELLRLITQSAIQNAFVTPRNPLDFRAPPHPGIRLLLGTMSVFSGSL